MARRYRCRHDIVASILRAIIELDKANISRISLAANLPIDRARIILKELESAGLVYYESRSRLYFISDRGYEWLAIYEALENVYGAGGPTTG